MAEPRRVPFVSLSPVRTHEASGSFVVDHQRTLPLAQCPTTMPQQPRPPQSAMQQRHPPPQSAIQRPPRETSLIAGEAGDALITVGVKPAEKSNRPQGTVRLELALTDPTEESCAEFSYPDLIQSEKKGGRDATSGVSKEVRGQTKPLPSLDPFNDDERERIAVENLAKKFETKYYDELVPASLTTKYGGFYINTGTLQFRQASDSENEDSAESKMHKPSKVAKVKEDRSLKKRKRNVENTEKDNQPRRLKISKQIGVATFNAHKPDKKKKKMYKDSLSLAAMLQKFEKEKNAMRKKEGTPNPPTVTVVSAPPKPVTVNTPANDLSDLTLGNDPVLAIFGGGSERELLQEAANALEMLGDFDFDKLLDSASNDSPAGSDAGENGTIGHTVHVPQSLVTKPIPAIPEGLPAVLEKRIEDLKVAAKTFDSEGRKKFFTQEMNNILLDIELQLQELTPSNRNGVYGYIESFVPCNKGTLVKRLKKLHLHIQDDRLREPFQRLKMGITNAMPGQLNRYQEDCQAHNQAKNAKHLGEEERDKNPSDDDDEEKPGKRVMGPRKKFYWDDGIRNLLCNLIRIKLGCYELEPNKCQSAEDYLKTFMETEVKPLWPKGWMQSRLLFKESRSVHNHLTSATAKKKVILAPKPKVKEVKESSPKKEQKTSTPHPAMNRAPSLNSVTTIGGSVSSNCIPPSETICLDDSLDEELSFKHPSLDSICDALAVLNNGTNAPSSSCIIDTPISRPKIALREEKLASIMSKLPLGGPKKLDSSQQTSSLIAGHSAPLPKKPQDSATGHSTVASGLIAGSSIQNPKVSLEPLPAKLLQQGIQRSLQVEVTSSSTPKVKVSSAQSTKAACSSSTSTTPSSSPSAQLITSSQPHVSSSSSQVSNASSLQAIKVHQHPSLQQNYVSPLQATISKSHTNPVVRLTSSPQITSTSPIMKTPDKIIAYRPSSSQSPGTNPHIPVSRTASSSTSGNIIAKTISSQGCNQSFKSPFTVSLSSKPTSAPSSSTSTISASQSTTHHKLSSSILGRPSPTSSPLPGNRMHGGVQGSKNPSGLSNMPNSCTKQTSPSVRQLSPSPKMQNPPPKIQIQSQKPSIQTPKQANPSPKPLNPLPPGTIKTTTTAVINVPFTKANQNSITTSRTSFATGSGSANLGATKQPTPHRQLSASGSSITAASVKSAAAGSVLASSSPLTLMTSPLTVTNPNVTTTSLGPLGLLGGLVPVTMPFQFPLELLGFGSDTSGVVTSQGSTSTAFHHNLTQNILKGLQTTSHTSTIPHSSLPPHLQPTFTDGGQNKGDPKLQRKSQ
uniref:Ubinuclein 2 n=1 Tax=Leptobrachium leishanense TaxID=445787 RepID=A0A8C5PVZ9_9ANUR